MAATILLIRHGEKPVEGCKGVRADGSSSDHGLIVRGWQRAGALVRFFAPSTSGSNVAGLPMPQSLVAASPDAPGADPNERSRREEETITPLARMLNVQPNLSYGKGEEQRVATLAYGAMDPMLIVWEHENIPKLGAMIAPAAELPNEWPSDRFDLVWVFRPGPNGEYSFAQVPQLLLQGDSASPIAN